MCRPVRCCVPASQRSRASSQRARLTRALSALPPLPPGLSAFTLQKPAAIAADGRRNAGRKRSLLFFILLSVSDLFYYFCRAFGRPRWRPRSDDLDLGSILGSGSILSGSPPSGPAYRSGSWAPTPPCCSTGPARKLSANSWNCKGRRLFSEN